VQTDQVQVAPRRRWTPWRVALVVVVVGLVGMWIYILAFAAELPPRNQLADPAFGQAAEPVCKAVRGEVDALPGADTAETPADRAELVRAANRLLAGMLGQLRALAPANGDDATAVGLWLDDWDTYLADREHWATVLDQGDDEPFLETQVGGGPMSEAIDDFANVNDMPSCRTTYDL
jgi:hypothetical protein